VFQETPPISSYLVAFAVGPLASTPELTVAGVPCRTFATPDKLSLCGYAQEVIAQALPLLVEYFNIPYPFGKLDQIAVPDFEAGAMENVGAVTFREVALLCDPQTAPLAVKKRIAEVITHEAVHQWFGNLVTMEWWDDLWLNEAFATWLAYATVDRFRPEWRIWLDWDKGKAGALALDALENTHPIHADVSNVDQAGENFDAITYDKGGAVLRMLEGYLGEGTFRDGVRKYLRRHAYGNARAEDLWNALSEVSSRPVGELATCWVHRPGFPLLEVSLQGRALMCSQRRFMLDPELMDRWDGDPWLVPLVVRYADEAGTHEERVLFRERSASFDLPGRGPIEWLVANAGGKGFWRVQYDETLLRALAEHLSSLEIAERIALLSDAWMLLRTGRQKAATVLDLLARFGNEQDHAVLEEVGSRFSMVEDRLATPETRPLLARTLSRLFSHQLTELGWVPEPGEPDDRRLRRATIIGLLGVIARLPAVVAEAEERFERFLEDPATLDPNLGDPVVLMAARAGDEARFDRILARIPKETDPASKRRLLLSLAAFEHPALTERMVHLMLEEVVPLQDMAFYLMRLLENRAAREATWAFLKNAWDTVVKRAGSPQIVRRIIKNFALLPERRHLDEVREFLAAHPVEGAHQAVHQTLERLRLDTAFVERASPDVQRWLREREESHPCS